MSQGAHPAKPYCLRRLGLDQINELGAESCNERVPTQTLLAVELLASGASQPLGFHGFCVSPTMNKSQLFGMWLEHCQGDFTSLLKQPRGRLSQEDAERVARYLENCPLWIAVPGIEKSTISPSDIAGTGSIRTDGQWAWQDTMAYYVRHLRISPPSGFVDEVNRRCGVWPAEAEINVDLLTLECC